jgi:DNA gyrase subunit A
MRAVIRLKKESNVGEILKCLYKYTELEVTFGINMVVIAEGKPQQLGLMDVIRHYVNYQQKVIKRRTVFDLKQAEQRCHILEGLIIAVQNIDEVIAIIKKSDSTADARAKLMERFAISVEQAQAILDLRLARLTKLEIFKLENELKDLKKLIKKLTAISKSKDLQLQVVKEELTEIKEKYPTPRKSRLVYTREEADDNISAMPEKKEGVPCTLVYTAGDTFKVLTGKYVDALEKPFEGKYKAQNTPYLTLKTITDKRIFAFTNYGNCHKLDIMDESLQGKLTETGTTLKDLSQSAEKGEKVVALFAVEEKLPYGQLLFFTKQGMIKKCDWEQFEQKSSSFPALKLNENDEVIGVEEDNGEETSVVMVTKGGICVNGKKEGLPTQLRNATGVRGIALQDGDEVIFASQITDEGEIIVVTDEAKFKKVIASSLTVTGRNKKGSMITSFKDGASVLFASYVTVPYRLAVVDKNGAVAEISSEDLFITIKSNRGKLLSQFAEDSVVRVIPLYYKKED